MDLIQFLHDRDFIMLLDEFHINNHYKVTLNCIKKDKHELKEEYIKFIKSVDLGEEDNKRFSDLEGITNPDAETIQDFFVILNREYPISKVLEHIKDSHLCFFIWLFGIFKNYISKLYEYHITVNNMPSKTMQHAKEICPELFEDRLVRFDGNSPKEEIICTLGISGDTYDEFVENCGLKRLLLTWNQNLN